jgi:pimeloyl-ACP methyl ester carboxylesterase
VSDSARDLLAALGNLEAPDLWDEITSAGRGVSSAVGDVSGNGLSAPVVSGHERRVFETAGLALSYIAVDGAETPIVFVHGSTSAASTWEPVMDRLDRGATYALDLRGNGRSSRSARYGIDIDSDDLASFLERVTGPAVLVGHSRGGVVSFLTATKRPDLVRGVYSEDITPVILKSPQHADLPFMSSVLSSQEAIRQAADEHRGRDWLEGQLGQISFGDRSTILELLGHAAVRRWADEAIDCDPGSFAQGTMIIVGDATAGDMLGAVNGPVHVAYGDIDAGGVVTADELDELRVNARRPSMSRFEGNGHFIHVLDPDGFVDDLRSWMAANEL